MNFGDASERTSEKFISKTLQLTSNVTKIRETLFRCKMKIYPGSNLTLLRFLAWFWAHYQVTPPECLGKEIEQRNHPPKSAQNQGVLKVCVRSAESYCYLNYLV